MAGIGTRDSGEAPQRAARFKTGHISLNTSGGGGLAAPCGGCKQSGGGRDTGVELDYLDGLEQSGFKITNPNAKTTCGCGQSFH